MQAARQGQAGDFEGVLEAIELFFLDGKEDGLLVEKRNGGAAADGGDTKYAHESELARFWDGKHRLERQSTKIFALDVGYTGREEFIGH